MGTLQALFVALFQSSILAFAPSRAPHAVFLEHHPVFLNTSKKLSKPLSSGPHNLRLPHFAFCLPILPAIPPHTVPNAISLPLLNLNQNKTHTLMITHSYLQAALKGKGKADHQDCDSDSDSGGPPSVHSDSDSDYRWTNTGMRENAYCISRYIPIPRYIWYIPHEF